MWECPESGELQSLDQPAPERGYRFRCGCFEAFDHVGTLFHRSENCRALCDGREGRRLNGTPWPAAKRFVRPRVRSQRPI